MEKISKTLSKEYLPVKVFIDDLKKIEEVLNNITSSRDFEIRTSEYKFANIEELVEKCKGEKINYLEISIHNPYITIEFKKMWTRLYCGSDDMVGTGAFHKIDSIVSSTLRKPSFFYSYYFTWGFNILWLIFLNLSSTAGKVITGFVLALSVVWIFWVGYIRLMNSSEIVFENKGSVGGWFIRNRDQLFVQIIITLVTIVGTVAFTHYFPELLKFLPNSHS
ncbi:hypothetical protein KBA63_02150 [Candidatus Woesebacteria bacterium]|nr:hypothetical protein [Candidatus Woesebacteria bacterium]